MVDCLILGPTLLYLMIETGSFHSVWISETKSRGPLCLDPKCQVSNSFGLDSVNELDNSSTVVKFYCYSKNLGTYYNRFCFLHHTFYQPTVQFLCWMKFWRMKDKMMLSIVPHDNKVQKHKKIYLIDKIALIETHKQIQTYTLY